MRRLAPALAAALAAVACAHAPSTPHPEPVDAGAPDAGAEAHLAVLSQQLSELRGLALLHPIPAVTQKAPEFRQAFRHKSAREARLSGADKAEFEAEWVAFGFVAPAGSAPDAGVSADQVGQVASGVLDEQIAGYYDEFEHRMHLPEVMPSSVPQAVSPGLREAMQDFLVAHELEHALQDQHFGFERLMSLPANSEARLATNAVYEGDAMLAGLLHLARAQGLPPARILQLTDAQLSRGELQGMGKELDAAPPVLRERLLFPYAAGYHLCLALYRTGGFKLVDQLFTHPPQTAEQLLHPEKYVSGEPAVPVRTPEPPPGFTPVDSGTLGELGARVVLLEAHGPLLARRAVENWGGDAYLVAKSGKRLALLWVTTWDDPGSAAIFERALRAVAASWRDGPAPEQAPSWTIGREAFIRREANRVVLVRGLPELQAMALLPSLLSRVGAPPAAVPPLGKLVLAGPPETGAVLPDGAYGSEPWSLYVPTPAGFRAIADPPTSPGLALLVVHGHPLASGSFGILMLPFSKARSKQVFEAAATRQPRATREAPTTVDLGWTRAETQLAHEGEHHTRTVVAPACGGKATWVFQLGWSTADDERALMDWLGAFAPKGAQPACSEPR